MKWPDALPAVNSRLQSRAVGAVAPESTLSKALGGREQVALWGLHVAMGALCTVLVSLET